MFPAELRGVIDVAPFAALAKRRAANSTVTLTAVGTVNQITVPENEVWLIEQVSFSFGAANTNDVIQAALRYNPTTGASFLLDVSGPPQAQPGTTGRFFRVGETVLAKWQPAGGFVATSGDVFTGNAPVLVLAGGINPVSQLQVLYSAFEK